MRCSTGEFPELSPKSNWCLSGHIQRQCIAALQRWGYLSISLINVRPSLSYKHRTKGSHQLWIAGSNLTISACFPWSGEYNSYTIELSLKTITIDRITTLCLQSGFFLDCLIQSSMVLLFFTTKSLTTAAFLCQRQGRAKRIDLF